MAQIDALLRLLLDNDGDTLELALGRPPALLRRGERLRMFLPDLTPTLRDRLLGELRTDERLAALVQGGEVAFTHRSGEGVDFEVVFTGTEVQAARFGVAKEDEADQTPGPAPEHSLAEPPAMPAAVHPEGAEPPPVAMDGDPRLVALLGRALAAGASDLHVAEGEVPVVRVDGRLHPLADEPACDAESLLARLLVPEARAALDAGRSVDKALSLGGATRVRANLYRCDRGFAAAFRLLRRTPPTLDRLDFPADLRPVAAVSRGLVVVCGPTGSGKSTTLASLAQHVLDHRGGLLITVEDPIEYGFTARAGALVRQREIGRHARDFASGLRDALREDPDVLLIGEMRDRESITLALTAAETGHLVLSSLHSASASSAIERIVDVYPPERQAQIRVQLADVLRVVLAQRLLPRAGGRGRVPAVEVLHNTRAVAGLIRDGRTAQILSVLQTGASAGMVSMEHCLRDLVRTGAITAETAEEAANDLGSLRSLNEAGRG